MKKNVLAVTLFASTGIAMAQKISFQEYDLPNGLHVILHQDNTAPVVTTGVMYHVGSKDDTTGKTGFAHFFEHLLFEGTQNIERGKWFSIVSSNGGKNNAFTSTDKTYYYEVFPSNNLQLGLWMEAERMLHPVINQIGVDTQKEVVKEEKRQRIDNVPYGKISYRMGINPHLFKKHPYRQSIIGSMEDLDSATLDDFSKYNQRYYNPNNAVLVVTGDIDIPQTKEWVEQYFASIPNNVGKPVRNFPQEEPITQTIKATEYDANIRIPAKVYAYVTPKMTDKDAVVFDFISNILTGGNSARLYKKMVEDKQEAMEVFAFNDSQEDYGTYVMVSLPMGNISLEQLGKSMDEEIIRLQNELISEKEYQKLLNQFEKQFVSSNSSMQGIALSLANAYMFHKNTNAVNETLDNYRKVSREDIRRVAKKYLNANQRLDLDYLPEPQKL